MIEQLKCRSRAAARENELVLRLFGVVFCVTLSVKILAVVVLGTVSNDQVQHNAANAPSSNSDIDYASGDIPATCPQIRC
jgi:hypothetical protein